MRIVIKENELEYSTDYPEGWFFSAGDPFKFPVMLKGTPCFVKRFEQKNPATISGWELLKKLRGKNIPTLPRLFDISQNVENGKTIHYVFYEFMQGKTFDRIQMVNEEQDLINMRDGLFTSFEEIHKLGYWAVDFCEKNIFRDHRGVYSIIDLDSTYPLTERPRIDMFGSKEYWTVVIDYYKQVCQRPDVTVSRLPGNSFNYLQSLFLLLRLKIGFSSGMGANVYNDTQLYANLPRLLHETVPDCEQFFLKAVAPNHLSFSTEETNQIKHMSDNIIRNEFGRDRSASRPVDAGTTQRQTIDTPGTSFLSINEPVKQVLQSAMLWARILSIMGLSIVGFLFLASFPFAKNISHNADDSVDLIIAAIITAVVFFFPFFFLLQFSIKMKQALAKNEQPALQKAFSNIRNYLIYGGVFMGLFILFFIIFFLANLH